MDGNEKIKPLRVYLKGGIKGCGMHVYHSWSLAIIILCQNRADITSALFQIGFLDQQALLVAAFS